MSDLIVDKDKVDEQIAQIFLGGFINLERMECKIPSEKKKKNKKKKKKKRKKNGV